MMAKKRLVVVRDVDEMKAADQAELVPYVSAPVAEACLVMVAEKADQRLKLVAACKKSGVLLKLDPLYERQLPAFLEEEARARGVRFGRGVAQLVCNEIGADLGQLADAVERLAIFVGGDSKDAASREVTIADVEEVVVGARQRSVFELAEAVGQGDRPRALTILHSLIQARESGVRLVAMLARHVRQLWTARALAGERLNKFDLAGRLGVAPFFVDGIVAQARRLSESALERMHAALYRADVDLKSSRVDDALLLERLILQDLPDAPLQKVGVSLGDRKTSVLVWPSGPSRVNPRAMRISLCLALFSFSACLAAPPPPQPYRGVDMGPVIAIGDLTTSTSTDGPPTTTTNPDLATTPPPSGQTTTLRIHYPAGHAVTIRGSSTPLNWMSGATTTVSGTTFTWTTTQLTGTAEWKPLLDGTTWALGPNYHVTAGQTLDIYPHFTTAKGTVSTLISSFPSTVLAKDGTRAIYAYLPPSYNENTTATYPVVYMHDGQNLWTALPNLAFQPGVTWEVDTAFDNAAATGACAAAGTSVAATGWAAQPLGGTAVTCNGDGDCTKLGVGATCQTFPEAIVIGGANTSGRFYEYTPTSDPDEAMYDPEGGADLYLQMNWPRGAQADHRQDAAHAHRRGLDGDGGKLAGWSGHRVHGHDEVRRHLWALGGGLAVDLLGGQRRHTGRHRHRRQGDRGLAAPAQGLRRLGRRHRRRRGRHRSAGGGLPRAGLHRRRQLPPRRAGGRAARRGLLGAALPRRDAAPARSSLVHQQLTPVPLMTGPGLRLRRPARLSNKRCEKVVHGQAKLRDVTAVGWLRCLSVKHRPGQDDEPVELLLDGERDVPGVDVHVVVIGIQLRGFGGFLTRKHHGSSCAMPIERRAPMPGIGIEIED